MAHRGEIKMNQFLVKEAPVDGKKSDIKVFIKPLSDDAAFNKGVEYLTEIIFFYGVLIGLGIYEVKKAYIANEEKK